MNLICLIIRLSVLEAHGLPLLAPSGVHVALPSELPLTIHKEGNSLSFNLQVGAESPPARPRRACVGEPVDSGFGSDVIPHLSEPLPSLPRGLREILSEVLLVPVDECGRDRGNGKPDSAEAERHPWKSTDIADRRNNETNTRVLHRTATLLRLFGVL